MISVSNFGRSLSQYSEIHDSPTPPAELSCANTEIRKLAAGGHAEVNIQANMPLREVFLHPPSSCGVNQSEGGNSAAHYCTLQHK
jgi:hypothetical protein